MQAQDVLPHPLQGSLGGHGLCLRGQAHPWSNGRVPAAKSHAGRGEWAPGVGRAEVVTAVDRAAVMGAAVVAAVVARLDPLWVL